MVTTRAVNPTQASTAGVSKDSSASHLTAENAATTVSARRVKSASMVSVCRVFAPKIALTMESAMFSMEISSARVRDIRKNLGRGLFARARGRKKGPSRLLVSGASWSSSMSY